MEKDKTPGLPPPSGRLSGFSSGGNAPNTFNVKSETGSFGQTSEPNRFSHDVSKMPDNPPKNLGHRRAHSEILTLPDDISFDSDLGVVGAADGPSYSDETEEDLLSMYLDMDKFNSSSATSAFQVGESSVAAPAAAPVPAVGVGVGTGMLAGENVSVGVGSSEKPRVRHQHSQSMDGSTNTNGLTAENSELKLRLQTMEQQVHLQDALNDALKEEIQHLKVLTGQSMPNGGPMMNFTSFGASQHIVLQNRKRRPAMQDWDPFEKSSSPASPLMVYEVHL
ncbi:hypothetical protein QQP08_014413 [Theobroma cacao]|nr:hypothetical protein QQP08_014413 [Theobroma cacao]